MTDTKGEGRAMYTATATGIGTRYGVNTMRNTNSKPKTQEELAQIAHKVRMLRNLTKQTGFFTTKSVGQMLEGLTADELVQVQELSEKNPPTAG
jgi:hypothetical protein